MASNAQIEEWRQIEGFKGFSVSSMGRVKREPYISADGASRSERFMVPHFCSTETRKFSRRHSGYYRLIRPDGTVKLVAGCDLVAKAFLGLDRQQHKLAFRDSDSRNIAVSNLYLIPRYIVDLERQLEAAAKASQQARERKPQVRRTMAERLAEGARP